MPTWHLGMHKALGSILHFQEGGRKGERREKSQACFRPISTAQVFSSPSHSPLLLNPNFIQDASLMGAGLP